MSSPTTRVVLAGSTTIFAIAPPSGAPDDTVSSAGFDGDGTIVVPNAGTCAITSPAAIDVDACVAVSTASPSAPSCWRAAVIVLPTTHGIVTGWGPFETLSNTVPLRTSAVPPAGSCAITVPAGCASNTSVTFGVSVAAATAARASSTRCPTTSGTVCLMYVTSTWNACSLRAPKLSIAATTTSSLPMSQGPPYDPQGPVYMCIAPVTASTVTCGK